VISLGPFPKIFASAFWIICVRVLEIPELSNVDNGAQQVYSATYRFLSEPSYCGFTAIHRFFSKPTHDFKEEQEVGNLCSFQGCNQPPGW
jgi:hypothetical protein